MLSNLQNGCDFDKSFLQCNTLNSFNIVKPSIQFIISDSGSAMGVVKYCSRENNGKVGTEREADENLLRKAEMEERQEKYISPDSSCTIDCDFYS